MNNLNFPNIPHLELPPPVLGADQNGFVPAFAPIHPALGAPQQVFLPQVFPAFQPAEAGHPFLIGAQAMAIIAVAQVAAESHSPTSSISTDPLSFSSPLIGPYSPSSDD